MLDQLRLIVQLLFKRTIVQPKQIQQQINIKVQQNYSGILAIDQYRMSKKQQLKKQPIKQLKKQTKTQEKKGGKKQGKNFMQQNILQTMKHQIDFLSIFTSAEIQFLFQNYDVIVFERGFVLVKQKQVIDYVGVIINGGAISEKSKTKYKKNSFIGNAVSVFGLEGQRHPQTITAESDGIIFAVRIQAIINMTKNDLQNTIKAKIVSFLAQQTLCQLKKVRHFKSSFDQFEAVDEKIGQKFYQSNKLLSSLVEGIVDVKQRQKFTEDFGLLCAKQKSLICSKNSKPYFLIVVKGQVVIKYGFGLRKQTQILEANQVYNAEGFILDHNQFSNLYCSSSETVFLMVDKQHLANNFRLTTQCAVIKWCLQYLQKTNQYEWGSLKPQFHDEEKINSNKEIWSPFKKPYTIEQIPIKKERIKSSSKGVTISTKKKDSINVFQTLYSVYSHNSSSKNKLHSKETQLTEYRETSERLGTVKTQYSLEEKSQSGNMNQKLKKLQSEVFAFKEQSKIQAQSAKLLKLDLMQASCRLKMTQVFREIKNLGGGKQSVAKKQANSQFQGKSVTLKQAYEKHLKSKKLQLLVAKCAFKWLQVTRRNRNKREQQQSNSSLIKSSYATVK